MWKFLTTKEPKFASLFFVDEDIHIWWKLDDILKYVINHEKHVKRKNHYHHEEVEELDWLSEMVR